MKKAIAITVCLALIHELLAHALERYDPLAALLMKQQLALIPLSLMLLLVRIAVIVVVPAALVAWFVGGLFKQNDAH